MKFLIFGSSGMAGNTIATYLHEKNHEVTGFGRIVSNEIRTIIGDVTDLELVKNTLLNENYDVIINCIGILNQFAEENKHDAVFLNSYFPYYLVNITKNLKTRVFLMSTDCVFSGEKGGYIESDFTDGKTFYDRSKALGEINDNKNLTIRTSIVGPDIKESGIGLLNWFMKQNGTVKGFTNALWTGVTTLELAKVMEYAANSNVVGLVNMVNNTPISKYNLLKLFNKYFKDNKLEVLPFDDFISNKSLIRTNFDLNYNITDYDTMICELAVWVKNNQNKYPHYQL